MPGRAVMLRASLAVRSWISPSNRNHLPQGWRIYLFWAMMRRNLGSAAAVEAEQTSEATMGILELSIVLACASAIGFYIADGAA